MEHIDINAVKHIIEYLVPRVGIFCFILFFGSQFLCLIISWIQDMLWQQRFRKNLNQIMHRLEMQGILGVDITYHHMQFYVNYLDYEVSADSLLDALLVFQAKMFMEGLYHPPKWLLKKIKREQLWKKVKTRICA